MNCNLYTNWVGVASLKFYIFIDGEEVTWPGLLQNLRTSFRANCSFVATGLSLYNVWIGNSLMSVGYQLRQSECSRATLLSYSSFLCRYRCFLLTYAALSESMSHLYCECGQQEDVCATVADGVPFLLPLSDISHTWMSLPVKFYLNVVTSIISTYEAWALALLVFVS